MNNKPIFTVRLKQALEEAGMTQAELSRRTGIHKATINQYLTGRYKAKQDGVYKIAAVVGCDPMWLLGYTDDKDSNIPESGYGQDLSQMLCVLGGALDNNGNLSYNDIQSYETAAQEYRNKAYFYFRMKVGNLSPIIETGDLLLCRMCRQLNDGDMGLFIIDRNSVFIGKYTEEADAIVLSSINPLWEPRKFPAEQKNRVIIEAKVISFTHKFE